MFFAMRPVCIFRVLMLFAVLTTYGQAQNSEEMFTAALHAQQQGKFQEAAGLYEALLSGSPDRVDALSNLGLVYGEMGKYDKAVNLFERALKIAPSQTSIRLNLAMTYLQSKQYSRARAEAEKVVAAQPSSTLAHYVLGLSLLKLSDVTAGIEQLEMVLKAQPNNIQVASTLASAYMKTHEIEKASVLVKGVLSHSDTADAHHVTGTYYLLTGDARDAVAELQRAQQLNPALAESRSTLAEANALMGNLEPAEKFFEARVQSKPDDVEANAFLGWLFLENQELDRAQQYLDRAHALRPDDPAIDFQRARLARAKGDYPKALNLLETVIQQHPENTPAHVLLAETYMKLHRSDDARKERQIVNELNARQQNRQAVAAQ
jgi:tetratricopeptide (TPR) repeat protein